MPSGQTKTKKICLNCLFFRNDPKYLENEFEGWITLGSAYGSVRKDDGICSRHEEYLGAHDFCDQFQAGRTVE